MQKSLNTKNHKALLKLLRTVREAAGLRQIDVANRLGQPQSFVSKYESGERRLDLLELERVCEACDIRLINLVERYLSDTQR